MKYSYEFEYIPVYERASTNQHGERFKRKRYKKLRILKVKPVDLAEHKQLIIMGDRLNIPVRYDFDSHEPYLEIASGEEVKTLK